MKVGIGSARNTHLIYKNYGRIFMGRSWRDQLQDLSVRESAVLGGGVRNDRSQTEMVSLVRHGICGLWWVYRYLYCTELMCVCQERRSVDLISLLFSYQVACLLAGLFGCLFCWLVCRSVVGLFGWLVLSVTCFVGLWVSSSVR